MIKLKSKLSGLFTGGFKPSTRWVAVATIALIAWALVRGNTDAAIGFVIITAAIVMITEFVLPLIKSGQGSGPAAGPRS